MIVQGSTEWHAMRLGKATASRIADIIATTKTGPAASRANYAAELIAERLSGTPAPSFMNDAMRWGVENEAPARDLYVERFGYEVTETSFVDHPEIAMTGASPDGLVGGSGLLEVKCPTTATHLDTLEAQRIPSKYLTQMYWQMACTGRAWCDFVSYDPRLPPHLQLYVQRVERDHSSILRLEGEVAAFLAEVDERMARLNERYARAA